MKITDVRKCKCGAITVNYEDDTDSSMPEKLYNEYYPSRKIDGHYESCNYCVNHWGVDLCNCGSGEKIGECTNSYTSCKNHEPAQILSKKKNYELWK